MCGGCDVWGVWDGMVGDVGWDVWGVWDGCVGCGDGGYEEGGRDTCGGEGVQSGRGR